MSIKCKTPTQAGVLQKIKQLRWQNHAIFGILVNIRYQIENPNSARPLLTAAHSACKKFYLQYQSDGKFANDIKFARDGEFFSIVLLPHPARLTQPATPCTPIWLQLGQSCGARHPQGKPCKQHTALSQIAPAAGLLCRHKKKRLASLGNIHPRMQAA